MHGEIFVKIKFRTVVIQSSRMVTFLKWKITETKACYVLPIYSINYNGKNGSYSNGDTSRNIFARIVESFQMLVIYRHYLKNKIFCRLKSELNLINKRTQLCFRPIDIKKPTIESIKLFTTILKRIILQVRTFYVWMIISLSSWN